MRTELVNYIKGLKLKNLNVSDELPFSNSGIPLFMKNAKRIYIDLEEIASEPLINTFDYPIDVEVHTVKLYFTTDAKQLLSDYSNVISSIRAGKDVATELNYHKRDVSNSVSYENDMIVTEVEFRFTKLT